MKALLETCSVVLVDWVRLKCKSVVGICLYRMERIEGAWRVIIVSSHYGSGLSQSFPLQELLFVFWGRSYHLELQRASIVVVVVIVTTNREDNKQQIQRPRPDCSTQQTLTSSSWTASSWASKSSEVCWNTRSSEAMETRLVRCRPIQPWVVRLSNRSKAKV